MAFQFRWTGLDRSANTCKKPCCTSIPPGKTCNHCIGNNLPNNLTVTIGGIADRLHSTCLHCTGVNGSYSIPMNPSGVGSPCEGSVKYGYNCTTGSVGSPGGLSSPFTVRVGFALQMDGTVTVTADIEDSSTAAGWVIWQANLGAAPVDCIGVSGLSCAQIFRDSSSWLNSNCDCSGATCSVSAS